MSPEFPAEKTPTRPTPPWLKWTLLALLFTLSIAGFASSSLRLKKPANPFSAALNRRFKPGEGSFYSFSNFAGKTESGRRTYPNDAIICQGTIIWEDGKARAMINGQTITEGVTVNGIRILKITASNVLVGCRGETRRLSPGESFTPGKK